MYNIIHKMYNALFNKGKEKILECFYRNRSKNLYFSEILRETKLTPNTTLKHLNNLQKDNLLISIKKIGNTFYKVNKKNPQIYSIFAYFDYKRFNGLPLERKNTINRFIGELEFKPLILLVFGSTAKGNFSNSSDIDLLLVFNKEEAENKKIKEDIEAITGIKIQEFIISYGYFKEQLLSREDKVVAHAIKTGFVILGHNLFYRVVLNE